MSENDMPHEDLDLKEDFSGFTEVSAKEEAPPKIDVSEAVAKAQAQAQAQSEPEPSSGNVEDEQGPPLPGAMPGGPQRIPRGMFPPGMMPGPRPQAPSFWKTLLNRGLTILAVVAVGVLVWWWWSRNNGGGPGKMAEAAVEGVKKTVVEPIKKALKLPPLL